MEKIHYLLLLLLISPAAYAKGKGGFGDPVPNPPQTCALRNVKKGKVETFCSATLIGNGFLVTAAHCLIRLKYQAKMDPAFSNGEVIASCPNPKDPGKLPLVDVKIQKAEYSDGYYGEAWKEFDALFETVARKKKDEITKKLGRLPTEAMEDLYETVMNEQEVKDLFEKLDDAGNAHDVAVLRATPDPALQADQKTALGALKGEVEKLLSSGKCVVSGFGARDPEKQRAKALQEGVNIGVQFSFAASKNAHFGKEEEEGLLFGPVDGIEKTEEWNFLGVKESITTSEPYNLTLGGDSGGSVLCKDGDGPAILIAVVAGGNWTDSYCVSGTCNDRYVLLGETPAGKWVRKKFEEYTGEPHAGGKPDKKPR